MNYKILYLLTIILISFGSCVSDDTELPKINFAKIVGNYSGQLKICSSPDLLTDTICNVGTTNVMKVVVQNLQTISMSDQLGLYDTLKLSYINSVTENEGINHYFDKENPNSFFTLKFAEKSNSIFFEERKKFDTKINTIYFVGKK